MDLGIFPKYPRSSLAIALRGYYFTKKQSKINTKGIDDIKST